MNYQEIELSDLTPNKRNPRKNYKGQKYDELVDSIRKKGVIEPIIVRKLDGKGFEIVVGERRYRASLEAGFDSIPAVVRDLSDDEAFEFMTIENLQREDLTPLEEARGFKAYLDAKKSRKKNTATWIKELSERTGIPERYVRGRIKVLTLPAEILKAWEEGLPFGYLEQFMRITDPEKLQGLWEEVKENYINSVRELKEEIDGEMIPLGSALFKTKEAGCHQCQNNTLVQKRLWDIGEEKAYCLDPECFREHQRNFLSENWKDTDFYKATKTNGFEFHEELNWSDFERLWGKIPGECKKCEKFVTILGRCGTKIDSEHACMDPECYRKQTIKAGREAAKKDRDPNAPRVPWHGEYFREKFFKEAIPNKMIFELKDEAKTDDKLKLTLISILMTQYRLMEQYALDNGLIKEENGIVEEEWDYYRSDGNIKKVFESIKSLDHVKLWEALMKYSAQFILGEDFTPNTRRMVAEFLGIDLQKEWAADEEYLNKKTKKELYEFGEKFGIFKDKKVQKFMEKTFKFFKTDYKKFRKSELIKVFLESGIDLIGKVPDEILRRDE